MSRTKKIPAQPVIVTPENPTPSPEPEPESTVSDVEPEQEFDVDTEYNLTDDNLALIGMLAMTSGQAHVCTAPGEMERAGWRAIERIIQDARRRLKAFLDDHYGKHDGQKTGGAK